MLIGDRYLVGGGTALDLATALPVRLRPRITSAHGAAIFERRRNWRLVDVVRKSARTSIEIWERLGETPLAAPLDIGGVRSELSGARDGHPRSVDLITEGAAEWLRAVLDMAREATAAGFVPVSADVLGSILAAARWQWPPWLRDRSLVVITCDGQLSAHATIALLRLAGRDARPHLVVRGATSELRRPTRLVRVGTAVHEDHGSEPSARALHEDLAARAWDGCASAGVSDEAAAQARWAVLLAPTAEAEALARSALARGLLGQGRSLEARAALAPVGEHVEHLPEPARLRVACVRQQLLASGQPRRKDRALVDDFLQVLQACQEIEDEPAVLSRVLVLLRERLAADRLACVVRESGQVRIVSHVGGVPESGAAAGRALDAGVSVLPDPREAPVEGAWPVRYGAATVGVVWCGWRTVLPVLVEDADALMVLAATAIAPRLYAAAERSRPPAAGPVIPELIGESGVMRELRDAVLRAGRTAFPVLLEGESGSGKELVARAIHRASPRRDRRLSALNCAALADELAEAELFGHARGAFTGAVAERPGLFEDAHGGTLFLDEVSELSGRVQAKLLRVLQEQEVRRLGEAHVRRIDTRIIAATNRPLGREVEEGRFRRDLRYRLDVIRLCVPPLRDRLEDLPLLVRHYWEALGSRTGSRAVLSPAAMAALGQYDWPGNVRELQNVLASLIVAAPARGSVGARQLPGHVARVTALGEMRSLAVARREFETRFVRAALARTGGHPAQAARDLGLSRQGLSKLIERLGLEVARSGDV